MCLCLIPLCFLSGFPLDSGEGWVSQTRNREISCFILNSFVRLRKPTNCYFCCWDKNISFLDNPIVFPWLFRSFDHSVCHCLFIANLKRVTPHSVLMFNFSENSTMISSKSWLRGQRIFLTAAVLKRKREKQKNLSLKGKGGGL